jgi:polyhydroxybutyrate depolymerase
MHKPLLRPVPRSCALALLLGLAAAACSSEDRNPAVASATSPATPGGPSSNATPQQPADDTMASGSPTPSANGSTEAPPMNVDLRQPETATGSPGAQPMAEAPNAPAAGAPVPSAGCGSTEAVASGRFSIDVGGNQRDYILALPAGYNATRPYRLVFTWHPGGGTAQQTANNYYGLQRLAEDSAIFVSPEGIDNGWANTGGRDLAFLDAMLDRFQGDLCFDQTRLFSTGFSYGGMMSFAIACARADVFRAIAPMSGALYSGCENGDTPIAMFGFHGTTDTVVPIANGVRARDVVAGRNDCQPPAMAIASDGCLSFQGCSEGHPVTWCEFNGGHMPAPQSAQRIWSFFSQF